MRVWESATGKPLFTLEGLRSVNSAMYSPDEKYIAAGYDDSGNKIRIWNAATGNLIRTLDSGRTWKVVYHPDGKYLAAATSESRAGKGGVKLYNTSDWSFVLITDKDAFDAAFSPEGKYIAVCRKDAVGKYQYKSGESHCVINGI